MLVYSLFSINFHSSFFILHFSFFKDPLRVALVNHRPFVGREEFESDVLQCDVLGVDERQSPGRLYAVGCWFGIVTAFVGNITAPPPLDAAASIAELMARESIVIPSPLAPKSVTRNLPAPDAQTVQTRHSMDRKRLFMSVVSGSYSFS